MKIDVSFASDFKTLTDAEISQVIRKAIAKLVIWIKAEAKSKGRFYLKVRNTGLLNRRFMSYKRGKGLEAKLWLGAFVAGVEEFGEPQQTKEGVIVNEELHRGAFINYMNSDQPLVWRRTTKHRKSIERVTHSIESGVDQVMNDIAISAQSKLDELLGSEINAIL